MHEQINQYNLPFSLTFSPEPIVIPKEFCSCLTANSFSQDKRPQVVSWMCGRVKFFLYMLYSYYAFYIPHCASHAATPTRCARSAESVKFQNIISKSSIVIMYNYHTILKSEHLQTLFLQECRYAQTSNYVPPYVQHQQVFSHLVPS